MKFFANNKKTIVITEEQANKLKQPLNEGLSSILYHFTTITGGFNIAKDDVIYLQSAYSKDADNYDKKRKYYLSCTRQRGSQFGYSRKFRDRGVRIVLDGDKLSNNFKGKQINYWHGMNDKYTYYKNMPKNDQEFQSHISWYLNRFKKEHPDATEQDIQNFIKHNFNTDAQGHLDNESEDRLFSYEPSIKNAHEYIISIDVLLPNVLENKEDKKIAWSFIAKTPLSKYIKIFNSQEQFDSPNGKDVNNEITNGDYFDDSYNGEQSPYSQRRLIRALKSTIQFIAFANKDFEGKNFGKSAADLLQKYGLTNYSKEIGNMAIESKRIYSARQVGEELDSIRRELSDRPNRDTANISKMLTDYCMSIGANSFRDAYVIKSKMADEYYGHNGKVYDRIDTVTKQNFYIVNKFIIVNDPSKTLFKDAIAWDDDELKSTADSMADEITYNQGQYNYTSKNYNSMFQFLYKQFRKGTLQQVMETLNKIGINPQDWRIDVQQKQLDYWDAVKYKTPKTARYEIDSDYRYDYMKVSRQNDNEIEQYFPKKQDNQ